MSKQNIGHRRSSNPKPCVTTYPIFPLPIFLLGGGMQRLRIFEPKYLSMVAEATQENGFVITMANKNESFQSSLWGFHVQVVDFAQGSDGVLTIDVLADNLVTLKDFKEAHHGFLRAKSEVAPHWSSEYYGKEAPSLNDEQTPISTYLAAILKGIFELNSELNNLYKTKHFDYPNWVSARLLEILPLPKAEKEKFIHQLQLHHLNQLLLSVFEKERPESDLVNHT